MATPSFSEWMREQVGPKWVVVNVRTAKRVAEAAYNEQRLLLVREYRALVARFVAQHGEQF